MVPLDIHTTLWPNYRYILLAILAKDFQVCLESYYLLFSACVTVKGNPCVFPFKYEGVEYDACTRKDSVNGAPWCAVQVINILLQFPKVGNELMINQSGPMQTC